MRNVVSHCHLIIFVLAKSVYSWSCSQILTRHSARPVIALSRSGLHALPTGDRNSYESSEIEWLKNELTKYLQKRKDVGADDRSQQSFSTKVIGGDRGNPLLQFVSAAPNKERVIDDVADIFDYDELIKFGYGNLATPIMKAGGRLAMYELMGLEQPAIKTKPKPMSAPPLVIDRSGKSDPARYSGLKLGQVLDDSVQAAALEAVEQKVKAGQDLRPKLEEELFERPFADRRNTGPRQTPDWTPEKLDDWGRQRGRAMAWARRAKEGEFVSDPYESLDLNRSQRIYSAFTLLLAALVFGKSTPTMLASASVDLPTNSFDLLQLPTIVLVISCVGFAGICASQASGKNRNTIVWFVKGLLGGPLAASQLRSLGSLITVHETEVKENKRGKP